MSTTTRNTMFSDSVRNDIHRQDIAARALLTACLVLVVLLLMALMCTGCAQFDSQGPARVGANSANASVHLSLGGLSPEAAAALVGGRNALVMIAVEQYAVETSTNQGKTVGVDPTVSAAAAGPAATAASDLAERRGGDAGAGAAPATGPAAGAAPATGPEAEAAPGAEPEPEAAPIGAADDGEAAGGSAPGH